MVVNLSRLVKKLAKNSIPEVSPVVIGLGANSGDPEHQLLEAIELLSPLAQGTVKSSSLWRTEPVDMQDDSGEFINAVAAFDTSLTPEALLSALQQIEVKLGRPAEHGKNVARTIDLDILLYGKEMIDLPTLKVPHPRMLERLFVLLPLQEIASDQEVCGHELRHWIQAAPAMEISKI